ncbi:hypothetical protein HDV04_004653 [Boothiomyces sp. JEL0838]|nr:hypothetical protein HDV04_004636 [Boothiomyces sp. JEL0838]KAJ3310788.1 hypothetical protein HDV04_004653 [Boothiomyces sp. JEL0838]
MNNNQDFPFDFLSQSTDKEQSESVREDENESNSQQKYLDPQQLRDMFAENPNQQQWNFQQPAADFNYMQAATLQDNSTMNAVMTNPEVAAVYLSIPPQSQPIFLALTNQVQKKLITPEEFGQRVKNLMDPNLAAQNIRKEVAPKPMNMNYGVNPIDSMKRNMDQQPSNQAKRIKIDSTPNTRSQQYNANRTPQNFNARWPNQCINSINQVTPTPGFTPVSNQRISLPSSTPAANTPKAQEVELDLEGMMDASKVAGIDLREEEFALTDLPTTGVSSGERYKEVPFLNITALEKKVLEIAKTCNITAVDSSFSSFLSQAADAYILNILSCMCNISEHRSSVEYDVFVNNPDSGTSNEIDLEIMEESNVREILLKIENDERIEQEKLLESVGPRPTPEDLEQNPESLTSSAVTNSTSVATTVNTNVSTPKSVTAASEKKPKRPATKKDLPEAVKNKMTNNAAKMAAGGTMKSWMLPGASIAAVSTPKVVPKEAKGKAPERKAASIVRAGSRLRTQKRITIKDALLAMELQRELKSSELLYKWWTNVK